MSILSAQVLLGTLTLVFLVAAVVVGTRARRWWREHGEPEEPSLIDPELTRFGTPFSPIRERATRLVRDGGAADDPATAYVAHRLAERISASRENPWANRTHVLVVLAQAPVFAVQGLNTREDAPFFLVFFLVAVAVAIAMAVFTARRGRGRRENAERAVELNRALAESYKVERDRQEAMEHARSE